MEDSAGSADAEMEKVEETITFKLNKLKEVWTGFLQSAASKELIKTIIDGLTSISEAIVTVLETPGLNVAAITAFVTVVINLFKNALNPAREFLAVIKSITGESSKLEKKSTSSSVFSIISSMLNDSSSSTGAVSGVAKIIEEAANTDSAVESLELLTAASEEATGAVSDTGIALDKMASKIGGSVSATFSGLASKLGISTAALGAFTAAAVAAAAIGLYVAYKKDAEYVENLNSEVEELTSTFNSNKASVESTLSSISNVKDRYYELASGVDECGNNVSLSTEEFEEYNEISDQIGDAFPELIDGYTDTGVKILTCKDNIDALNEACEKRGLEEYFDFATNENINKISEAIDLAINGRTGFFPGNKTYGINEKQSDLEEFKSEYEEYRDLITEMEEEGITASRVAGVENDLAYLGSTLDSEAEQYYNKIQSYLKDFKKYGKEFNIDVSSLTPTLDMSEGDLDSNIRTFEKSFQSLTTSLGEDVESVQENFKSAIELSLSSLAESENLDSETITNLAKFFASIFDEDQIAEIIGNGEGETYAAAIDDFIQRLADDPKFDTIKERINDVMTIDSSSYASVGEARKEIDNITDTIGSYLADLGYESEEIKDLTDEYDELTSKLKEAKQARKDAYDDEWFGNVNLTDRPTVSGVDMEAAGYAEAGGTGSYSTVYTNTIGYDNPADGTPWIIQFTPILPNGKVLNENGWSEYLDRITKDKDGNPLSIEEVMERDKQEYGILFGVYDEYTNEETGKTEKLSWNENIAAAIDYYEEVAELRHEDQADIYATEGEIVGRMAEIKQELGSSAFFGDELKSTLGLDTFDDAIDRALTAASNKSYSTKKLDYLKEVADSAQDDLDELTPDPMSENFNDYLVVYNKAEQAQENYQEALAETEEEAENDTALEDYLNTLGSTDQIEQAIQYLNDYTGLFKDSAEQIEYLKSKFAADEASNDFSASALSTLTETLDDIYTAYSSTYEKIKNGKIGTELAADIEDVEKFRDSFNGLEDVNWGDYENFDGVERVLTSGTASAEEMTDAWSKLYEVWVDAKLVAGDWTTETQKMVSAQLQVAGATKESADAYVEAQVAANDASATCKDMLDSLSVSEEDLADMTADEVSQLANKANASEIARQALYLLWLQNYQLNNASLDTTDKCQAILDIAEAAGVSYSSLTALQTQMQALGAMAKIEQADATGSMDDRTYAKYKKIADQYSEDSTKIYENTLNAFKENMSKGIDLSIPTSSSGSGSGGSGGGSSDSDSTDAYVEAFEAAYDRLGELRDRDKIDEYEYLQYLRALYEKYFKNKEEYIEEFEKYESEYLEDMKSLYDDVFSYLTSQIDDQISKLEEQKSSATESLNSQKDAAVDALEAEKEAAVANIEAQIEALEAQQDAIQDEIDAYQDEIDAINDANDAREREITLQKALYELDSLNSQRTNLVYSESQGMHYEADLSGIRDARESVDDAKDDIEIANLEKKIELLEDEKDALDDLIDDLEDQKDAIEDYYDNLIDETEEYWDNLIEESEAYYDSLIDSLEDTKTGIEEFTEAYDKAKQMANFEDLTGIKATDVFDSEGMIKNEELFSQAVSKLQTDYSSLIVSMEEDNSHVLNSFAELTGIDLSSTTGYIEKTAAAFDKFSAVDFDSIGNGLQNIQEIFSSLKEDSDFAETFGQHIGEGLAEALRAAKESVEEDAEEAGTSLTKGFGTGMTSEEAKASVKESAKEVVSEVSNSAKESAENGDAKEATDAAGTAIVKTVSDGMTSESATATLDEKSPEVITAAATSVTNAANGEQNADMLTAGEAIVCAIVNAMNSALDGAAGLAGLDTFVTKFATKLQEEFSKLDLSKTLDFASLLGLSGEDGEDGSSPLSTFIQQFVDAITKLNEQVKLVDISPIVLQFQNLKQAITEAATALGGGEGEMLTEATGAGTENGQQANSNSGSEGSLISAMETLETTADEVLGGGGEKGEGEGDEGGAGIIGKFATLKTKVQDVTAAIGLGEDEEGGGSGTSEDEGTLISSLQAEGKVALNEETGLPAQNEQWANLETNIQSCVDAVERLIDSLTRLEEFSLTVTFSGNSEGFAEGTLGEALGTFNVSGYAGGNIGLKKDQKALIGEVGYEGLVRGQQFSLIGQRGAEMMDLKKGDIIFSHSQTKELLKNGKIHSRGRAIGTHSYADGTPFNKALTFAGRDISSSALTAIANQLTGAIIPIDSNVEAINRNVADMAANVSNISNVNNTSNVTIGDIHVTGVQDVDGFAKAIKSYLPGKMTQALYS